MRGRGAAARRGSAPRSAELTAGAANADITPPIGTPQFAYTARSRLAGGAPQDIALQIIADPDGGLYAKTFAASRGIHTRVRARAIVLRHGDRARRARAGGPRRDPVRARPARVRADPRDGHPAREHHDRGHPHALVHRARSGRSTRPATRRSAATRSTRASSSSPRTGSRRRSWSRTPTACPRSSASAKARVTNASRNRNFEPFKRNEDVPKDEAAAKEASIDPLLTVIRVDEVDGRPIGVWSNFAIHQTSFGDENLLFSGDNAAFTERIVETEIRRRARKRGTPARRPGTVVNVWTNSNEGDISPDGGTDKVRRAHREAARSRRRGEPPVQRQLVHQRAHGRDEGRARRAEGVAQGRASR